MSWVRWTGVMLLVSLAVAGCGDAPAREAGDAMGLDTVGGVEVAWSQGAGAWGADTLRAEHVLTIGEIEGAAEYLFGMITGIAVDAEERIYVADGMASNVRVYGAAGDHLSTIGREGEGPGEFQFPMGVAFSPDGALHVRDVNRVTRFEPGAPGAIADGVTGTWPGPPYPNHRRTARFAADGRFLYPREHHPIDGESSYFYLVYSEAGELLDTLHVPDFPGRPAAYARYRVSERSGRMVPGLNHPPFAPLPVWDVTPRGTVMSGDGSRYALAETSFAGDTVRRIERRNVPLAEIRSAEKQDSAGALQLRIDTLPVPLSRVENVHDDVRAGRLPERYPAFVGVHAGVDGRIWVERWPPAEGAIYDVFEPGGVYLGVVRLPVRPLPAPAPIFTARAVYGVVVDPHTEVQRVVKLRFSSPGAPPPAAQRLPLPKVPA